MPTLNSTLLNDISERLSALLANSPAHDIEKNVKAFLATTFTRLDLVTREEFDVQREVLNRTRARLEALEAKVSALEADKQSGS